MLDIKHNYIPTVNNKHLVIVHWHDGQKHRVLNKISSSQKVAKQFVSNKKRDILLEAVNKYVTHRKNSLDYNYTYKTTARVNAISKLKRAIDVYSQSPLKQVAAVILCLENDLIEIMPGTNSKYHIHFDKKINEIITFCKNIHNGIDQD
jgi:hypothetical protein